VVGELARPTHVAFAELDAKIGERARETSALEQRARSRQQHADLAATQPLDRLDALSRNLDVRLDLAEPFARRIERDGRLVDERVQIGEQTLRLRHAVSHDDDEARGKPMGERRHQRGVR
jgi:hypothetical protein